MNIQITFALFLVASVISLQDDGDIEIARKHYGLSFHSKCIDYVKSFTCMTTCKSIGFRVFRLDFRCKCSCHALKTTTILPFFKWRTNGTTKTLPSTQSPNLYHVAGTLSPPWSETTTPEPTTTKAAKVTCEQPKDNNVENTTVDDVPNANNSEATTSASESSPGKDEESATKPGDDTAKDTDAPQNPTEAPDNPEENPTQSPDQEPEPEPEPDPE